MLEVDLNTKEQINERVKFLEKTIKFLSNHENTERWAVNEFLSNIGTDFDQNELIKSDEEPSDIIFRGAKFQVKAMYDDCRKMIQEYKDELEKVKHAKVCSETIIFKEEYTPMDISIQEIVKIIEVTLSEYKLSPEQYSKINMLFYFNRRYHRIENDSFTFSNDDLWKKWGSVLMVANGGIKLVFWAKETAPEYIKNNKGNLLVPSSKIGGIMKNIIILMILSVFCIGCLKINDVQSPPKIINIFPETGQVYVQGRWKELSSKKGYKTTTKINSTQILCNKNSMSCEEHEACLSTADDNKYNDTHMLYVQSTTYQIYEWSDTTIKAKSEPRAFDFELRISLVDKSAEKSARETSARGAELVNPNLVENWVLE